MPTEYQFLCPACRREWWLAPHVRVVCHCGKVVGGKVETPAARREAARVLPDGMEE